MFGKNLGKGFGSKINNFVRNMMYTERGKIILSIILGLGLASIFRNYCKGKNCYKFLGPKQEALRNKIYSFDSSNASCYALKEKTTQCDNNKKIMKFA
jgi:hypothetical protein